MDNYYKTIQSRIKRRYKTTISLSKIRDIYPTKVRTHELPNNEELEAVVEHFNPKNYHPTIETNLTVVESKTIEKPKTNQITPKENLDIWEVLQPPVEEPQKLTQELIQTPSLNNSNQAQSKEIGELSITQNNSTLPTHQPEETATIGITQAQIEQAIELAIAQTGESSSTEAKEIINQLALHLKSDINTLEQAVAALVTGYLNKRSNLLKNAIGTLNTLRNAQTNSFCSGLTPDFLAKQETAKKQLMEIANTFN